jgi:hypothetical protein
MISDPEGWNAVQGKLAASAAARGDYSLLEARARAGDSLTQDELAAILDRDRGLKNKTGRKKPAINFEIWANFIWLYQQQQMQKSTAYSLLAEMTGQTESAVKSKIERIAKSDGIGRSIADQAAPRSIPPLLTNRDAQLKCKTCKLLACLCQRDQWIDTDAGKIARALVGFLDLV